MPNGSYYVFKPTVVLGPRVYKIICAFVHRIRYNFSRLSVINYFAAIAMNIFAFFVLVSIIMKNTFFWRKLSPSR